MFTRQKILLGLMKNVQKPMPKIQLVKLAFLFAQEKELPQLKSFYRFVPYQYGPFSFHLYHDLERMIDTGYLASTSKGAVSISGRVQIPKTDNGIGFEIDTFLKKYGEKTAKKLTEHVYASYPWFTINSSKPKQRKEIRPVADIAVYTAGYEAMLVDEFMNLLLKQGILRLIDIRHNPVARRYGFHKTTLSKICGHLGIDYHHIQKLGIPPELRTSLNSPDDYQVLFSHYKNSVLKSNRLEINQVADMVKEKPSVLVCMEADKNFCHRKLLAQKVSEISSLPVIELRR